ncbi:unnamed protein product, partial [Didymodactylos carnosus]
IMVNESGQTVSKESGRLVEKTMESNYMFKLSELIDSIKDWLEHKQPLYPLKYNKMTLDLINQNKTSHDISISRDSKRLSWGIPVPNDSSQVIYIWIDALINYLTVTGYPDHVVRWPPDCQIIGKEILRFHAIYWPGLLLVLNMDLPKKLIVHGHWLKDDTKMSKSLGNVVDPLDLLSLFQCDGVRYCLLREDILTQDANFNQLKMTKYLNAELANTFGNLLNRVTSKSINVKQIYPDVPQSYIDYATKENSTIQQILEESHKLPHMVNDYYEKAQFYLGIIKIMDLLRLCNAYVQDEQPWALAKQPDQLRRLECMIYVTLECLRISGILLQPIIPSIAENLLTVLNISKNERTFEHAKSVFQDYGNRPLNIKQQIQLYKRIRIDD